MLVYNLYNICVYVYMLRIKKTLSIKYKSYASLNYKKIISNFTQNKIRKILEINEF